MNHIRRQTGTERQTNPLPYKARYFGEKLHIDQNEKFVMFGLTHICAIDGFSGKIVGFAILPLKNNILIYQHFYRCVKYTGKEVICTYSHSYVLFNTVKSIHVVLFSECSMKVVA